LDNCTGFLELCKLINLKMSYDNDKDNNEKIIYDEKISFEKRIYILCRWAIKFHTNGKYIVTVLIKKMIEVKYL